MQITPPPHYFHQYLKQNLFFFQLQYFISLNEEKHKNTLFKKRVSEFDIYPGVGE